MTALKCVLCEQRDRAAWHYCKSCRVKGCRAKLKILRHKVFDIRAKKAGLKLRHVFIDNALVRKHFKHCILTLLDMGHCLNKPDMHALGLCSRVAWWFHSQNTKGASLKSCERKWYKLVERLRGYGMWHGFKWDDFIPTAVLYLDCMSLTALECVAILDSQTQVSKEDK